MSSQAPSDPESEDSKAIDQNASSIAPSSDTEGNAEENGKQNSASQAKRVSIVSAATMGSRLLGLVREQIFALYFGAGALADAFVVAYRIPNLLRDLFAEGALSAAFVPVFQDYRTNKGKEAAFEVAQYLYSFLLMLVGGLTILGYFYAGEIVDIIGFGFADIGGEEGQTRRELAIELTRILLPFLLLLSFAAVCRGILNSFKSFFLPAISPALFNIVAVGVGASMYFSGVEPSRAVYGWAMATLAGGALQFAIQLPALYRLGLRFKLRLGLGHPGIKRIMRLMAPATIGLAAVQVNIVISSMLSTSVAGAPSHLNYAFRLIYLPIGLIGVAIATVSAVSFSEAAAKKDWGNFRTQFHNAIGLTAFLALPAMTGLLVLAGPIIRLIYERGGFDASDTRNTVEALSCFGVGLFFFCAVKILAPAFYSLDRVKVPMIASITGVLANVLWSVFTFKHLGFATLAFGTALASTINCVILLIVLGKYLGATPWKAAFINFTKILIVCVLMGLSARYSHDFLDAQIGHVTTWDRMGAVFPAIIVGAIVLLSSGIALRLQPARDLAGVIKKLRKLAPKS